MLAEPNGDGWDKYEKLVIHEFRLLREEIKDMREENREFRELIHRQQKQIVSLQIADARLDTRLKITASIIGAFATGISTIISLFSKGH